MNGATDTFVEAPVPLEDDSPRTLARAYVESDGKHDGLRILSYWRGDFFRHDGAAHRRVVRDNLRARLYEFLESQLIGFNERKPLKPNTRKVNDVIDALSALVNLTCNDMPCWLDGHRPKPENTIAFPNGILDLSAYLNGSHLLTPPTPLWFSENVLPFEFDAHAVCPQWLAFLADVLSDDSELIELLQEWAGYLLTDSTAQQKALLLIGAPRGGKGSVIRQLVRTIGTENCASLRLTTLAERFGLESLTNKTAVVCPDAHLGRSSDHVAVLERLKSIIGEDLQSIDRKFREPLSAVRMRVRFTIAVNNFPDLPDSSAAMRSRLLIMPFKKNYEGHEDHEIENRLAQEVPGTLVWALEGLKRLKQRGRFIIPSASADLLKQFSRLSSPVLAFVEDRCQLDPELYVECDACWKHWRDYCHSAGFAIGNKQAFGLNLKSAIPTIDRKRRSRDDGTRFWVYAGLGLLPAALDEVNLE